MAIVVEENKNFVALIVGVTGMAGLSIAEALKSPKAPCGPWKVYGAARRPMPTWFPPNTIDHYLTFDATISSSTNAILSPLSSEITHVFWVALHEAGEENRNAAVNSTMLFNVLNALTGQDGPNPSTLCHITLQTGTKHYMGPILDPVISAQLGPPEIPFSEEVPRLPFPNFYYALEDVVASYAPKVTYSIHRASIIVGASARSVYNFLLTVVVYAEICKRLNAPFRFPGTKYAWEHFCDMSDAGVLADQHIWAAVTESAHNEAFNCTNGDVFTWRGCWRFLCDALGMEFVEFDDAEEFDWVGFMKGNGEVWDRIIEEKGLVKTKMEDVHPEVLHLVLSLKFQHVCCMNKSKELGFMGFVDSFKSVRSWIERLKEMKIIP